MSLPSINFLHLSVSEIQPRQTFLTEHENKEVPFQGTLNYEAVAFINLSIVVNENYTN